MKKMFLGLAVVMLTLTTLFTTSPVAATNNPPKAFYAVSHCQCVTYVVNRLFGGPRPGTWPTANSMATDAYWGNENVVGKGNLRYNAGAAAVDDVIIVKSNARVYVWNIKRAYWDYISGNVGYGNGHIGFVVGAKYYNKYTINGKQLSGWYITMQSANWDNDTDYTNGSPWSINGRWVTLLNCDNVNHSWLFIPTGNPVSFWRKK